ncbi:hypothetical protein ZHAS_00007115 [Anopheles sinensis]|uniref:Uncharacterized protein n=1 Tax=Anopheles sinensis TaxID=74873 RepID=A0A084VNT8_ANOSI|nr:hypothetical protein ZHAS_00007115 [Anopheles sinensis]
MKTTLLIACHQLKEADKTGSLNNLELPSQLTKIKEQEISVTHAASLGDLGERGVNQFCASTPQQKADKALQEQRALVHKSNLQKAKGEFLRDSLSLDQTLRNLKMSVSKDSSIISAMALIPEFRGSVDELEQFVRIVDRVHDRKIVEEYELLDILSKLRGEAVGYCHRLNAETWDDLKDQLSPEFGLSYTVETIFHRTEALCQRPHETFKKYRDRARKIVEMVIAYAPDNESLLEYASRHIKDHFKKSTKIPIGWRKQRGVYGQLKHRRHRIMTTEI